MLKIDQIQDPEKLRRVATLLDQTVDQLQKKVRDLSLENARLRGDEQVQVDFSFPVEKLEKALGETPPEPSPERRKRPDQKGHGPRPQTNLPYEEKLHELPESERGCPACGGTLEPMVGQSEDSEEVTVVERTYKVVLHRRQKYRCRCNGCIKTADGPLKLIPGGRYSLAFAAHTATEKYGFHLPLERQVEKMFHGGLEATSQTLWDQLEAAARVLEPTYEALGQWLMARELIHMDETGWRQFGEIEKPRFTAWCRCTAQAMRIDIASSKSEDVGRRLLAGFSGTVVADGYQIYKNLARGPNGFHLAHCWAHVLRKFRETEPLDPRSRWLLGKIGALYETEREIDLEAAGDAARHQALRRERAGPLVAEIRAWALAQGGLKRSDFGKAVAYLLSHWQGLVRFLDDPMVPLDNNQAERALRGLVLGRKNHYGSRSQRGANVSALFYSLIGTAKLNGLDPDAYLRDALTAALKTPGAVTLPF